jgi:hypothetical protein
MIEDIIKEGKISLIYSGLIFLDFASFLEIKSPIRTDMEISRPYHLIVRKPKFKNVSPGD